MAEDWLTAAFEKHRPHLRAVAYRLLGSMADADDAVQDTWLRLAGADTSEVENFGGWLTTVVARVSLNMLRSRRSRAEEPVGDSWPGAAETAASGSFGLVGDPEDEAVLADSVGLALLAVLDALTPAERLAFVLHDTFAMPFTEVADVLGRSVDATRQLASRARRRVRGTPSSERAADLGRQREVAAAFLAASRGGDFSALVALLDAEVTLTADGAAAPSGRPVVLHGAQQVARGALAASAAAGKAQLVLVNGSVGVIAMRDDLPRVVLNMTVNAASQITRIEVVADPARLRRLRLALLPD